MQKLNELRRQISDRQAERLAIQRQRCSREQVRAILDSWLANAEEQGRAALQLAVDRAMDGQAFAPLYAQGNAAVFQSPGAAPFSLDMGPLLISVLGKAAIKKPRKKRLLSSWNRPVKPSCAVLTPGQRSSWRNELPRRQWPETARTGAHPWSWID